MGEFRRARALPNRLQILPKEKTYSIEMARIHAALAIVALLCISNVSANIVCTSYCRTIPSIYLGATITDGKCSGDATGCGIFEATKKGAAQHFATINDDGSCTCAGAAGLQVAAATVLGMVALF